MIKINDIVKIHKQAMIDNGASKIKINFDEKYIVIKEKNIGEPAYNLKNINTEKKVFIIKKEEYNFVEDELIRIQY